MEHSDPLDTNPATPAYDNSSAGQSEQPTYTTAGTIYRPSSSQPLQAPTRRGRLLKWSTGGLPPELTLFPKSVLEGIPLKGPGLRPIQVLPQYTPLQQNYDRAVSPPSEADHPIGNMLMDTPRICSANTPKPTSVFQLEEFSQEKMATADEDRHSEDGSDDDDDNLDVNTSLLLGMTVKSLQNLASYPNPSQKHAQRALQRGTRPRPPTLGSSSMGSNTSASPPTMVPFNSPTGPSEMGSFSYMSNNQGNSDLFTSRRSQLDTFPRTGEAWAANYSTQAPALPNNPPRFNSTSSEASCKVTSASGTPLPLTAGPPGQRQYRPSVVESTLKAPATYSSPLASSSEEEDVLMIANQTLFHAGIEDVSIDSFGSMFAPQAPSPSYPKTTTTATTTTSNGDTKKLRPRIPTADPEDEERRYRMRSVIYGPSDRMKVWDSYEQLIQTKSWRDPSPEVRALYGKGTDRLTEEALAVRDRKTEEWWYSGVNNMYNRTRSTRFHLHKPLSAGNVGVIGDRRPQASSPVADKVSVEEAMSIPASEHARSLLEMAMSSMCREKDEKFPRR